MSDATDRSLGDYPCDVCALTGLDKETVDEAVECFRVEDKIWWRDNVVESDGTWWCREQDKAKIEYYFEYPFVFRPWVDLHNLNYNTVNSYMNYHRLYKTNSRKQPQLFGGSRKTFVCIDTVVAQRLIDKYVLQAGSDDDEAEGVPETGSADKRSEARSVHQAPDPLADSRGGTGIPGSQLGPAGLSHVVSLSDEVRMQLEIRIQEKDDRIDALEEEVRSLRDEIERRVSEERDRGEAALLGAQRRYEALNERYEKLYADCVRFSYAAGCSKQVLRRVEAAPFGVRISRRKYMKLIEGAVKEVGDTNAPEKPSGGGGEPGTYDEAVYEPGN